MKLSKLLDASEARIAGGVFTEDKAVDSLAYHSDEVAPGSMFFALRGQHADGREYIRKAIEKGASVVALEDEERAGGSFTPRAAELLPGKENVANVTFVVCKDLRRAMARAAARFYGEPSADLLTIGVTGTKGKTGTSFMIRNILQEAGIKTGIIGTVYSGYEGKLIRSARTTPESVDLQRMLREMADVGCRAVVMEVSSQGLKHSRVDFVDFDTGVFTNLSPDHIGPGEHADYEEYRFWKSTFFHMCPLMAVNGDDAESDFLLAGASPARTVFYGKSGRCDFRIEDCQPWREKGRLGVEYFLRTAEHCGGGERELIRLPLAGEFNAYNSAAAVSVTKPLGVPWSVIKEALAKTAVPGRTEVISGFDDFTVMVDYAHNGLALASLLKSLREYGPSRLTVVFGCGGERDAGRRREMGEAASRWADKIIITADNPRSEPPEKIAAEIYAAVENKEKAALIGDRRQAIRTALADACKGEIVVIAGKGHENYQITEKGTRRFDDAEEARVFAQTQLKAGTCAQTLPKAEALAQTSGKER